MLNEGPLRRSGTNCLLAAVFGVCEDVLNEGLNTGKLVASARRSGTNCLLAAVFGVCEEVPGHTRGQKSVCKSGQIRTSSKNRES